MQPFIFPLNRHRINPGSIPCIYCHDAHKEQEMKKNICPKMLAFAKKQQQKYSYTCRKCEGEGLFEERVQTKILEHENKFQARFSKWLQSNCTMEASQRQRAPQRRVIKVNVKISTIKCDECKGQGIIYRVITKNGTKIGQCHVNPIWLRYRMSPTIVQVPFECKLCSRPANQSDKSFIFSCGHEFHFNCITEYLKDSQQCPDCKEYDEFIDNRYLKLQDSFLLENSLLNDRQLFSVLDKAVKIDNSLNSLKRNYSRGLRLDEQDSQFSF